MPADPIDVERLRETCDAFRFNSSPAGRISGDLERLLDAYEAAKAENEAQAARIRGLLQYIEELDGINQGQAARIAELEALIRSCWANNPCIVTTREQAVLRGVLDGR